MTLMESRPFHASQVKTLAMQVEEEIERQILAGEIDAGERINEQELARSLGVSRGPVREALKSLNQAGLIQIVANKGAVVREVSTEEACELYDLRALLFALGAERLAVRRDDAQIAKLRANTEDMAAAIAAGDRETYYRLNLAFHDNIVTGSAMARTHELYRALVKQMHVFRRRGLLRDITALDDSLKEHRAIVAAIAGGDPAAAFAAARGHVLAGRKRFLAAVERDGAAPLGAPR